MPVEHKIQTKGFFTFIKMIKKIKVPEKALGIPPQETYM